MTKQTKRVLFYSAVAVFLILSYVIILYAMGYKYSFSDNRFFKTGAVYLKVNTDADVYLNDKFLGNTSFFGNSYRIEGLLPGSYSIRVQKNDYSTWQKSANIDEGFVNEFSKILLLSEDEKGLEELDKEIALIFTTPIPTPKPSPTPSVDPFAIKKGVLTTTNEKPEKIAENVKGFALSKDKNKLTWWTTNELWVMWLSDTNYQPYHKKGDKELITRLSTQIKKAAWFRDDEHLIVDSNPSTNSKQNGYKVLEIDTRGGINIIEI
ncbi:MAG: hypothetical protein A2655_04245 [Candidatus Yanofskybacteria bacterium RIFCSPHIGHO2_01_FULL_43_42]|uniref:PEGA domain-containing protein n=1 Tax=Candidatus Yanofskybacteria bacterium RIFCSPLOWO2_01_FULL_43_22 TaxID=1802695 RepID=A0A1F8GF21_9BACT|nr:MAG: hypothetical protein A2655_04245 [Candidatus Yanofskybacteria bacterium RIFCSPHIGHO2_01_FULL_43_42]OGN12704.1 MAG: hypothetical protein A3D48_01595 [Candidatus Yanofskybacteria bacterium RIFCSPHIGHO2_02_FULL_43_17]OGN23326.1 MAG: hypothetical protein A3A13_04365 [Candidatus Yanofskybacteria bacterium RIFCSPLOWO2_01_FULL_43_22]